MSCVFLQEEIFAEAETFSQDGLKRVRACVVGGNAHIVRYPEDPASGPVGYYTGETLTVSYPELPDSCRVVADSVQVFGDEVLLAYYYGPFSAVQDRPDQIVAKHDTSSERGIQVGDVVLIDELSFTITGLVGAALVLNHNIPVGMRDTAFHATLAIRRLGVEIPRQSYQVNTTGVQLPSGLTLVDNSWRKNGEPAPLPVISADICIAYKGWLAACSHKLQELTDFAQLNKIPGPDHPANELRWGVKLARRNSHDSPVSYLAVADPDSVDSWKAAIAQLKGVYGIVPLTSNPEVLELFSACVQRLSKAESGRECVLWRTVSVDSMMELATLQVTSRQTLDGDIFVEAADSRGEFVTLGVQAGDILRYADTACIIAEAYNEDTLRIQTNAQFVPSNQSVQAGIYRKRDDAATAFAVAQAAATCRNKRIRLVWPDRVSDDTYTFPGYFLCAALAGLRSGVAPQQPLAGVEIAGVTGIERTVGLSDSQELDMMAEQGVWVVIEEDGLVYTRQGLTTAGYGNQAEYDEMIVTNLDYINKAIREEIATLMHTVRPTKQIRQVLQNVIFGTLMQFSVPSINRLGPQLHEGAVTLLRRHVYLEDSLVLNLRLVVPASPNRGLAGGSIEVQQKIVV